MTPRKATLRVAHARSCPLVNATAIETADKGSGCTCKPSYYVMWRDTSGATCKSSRVRDRRIAQQALNKKQVEIDQGNIDVAPKPQKVTFPQWVDEYESILAKRVARGKLKARTEREYAATLARAADAIGHVQLRELGPSDLERFADSYGETASDATLAKAMRELGACLTEAVDAGKLDRNPVRLYVKKREFDTNGRGKDPFTDDELPKLWAALGARTANGALAKGGADPVYLDLCRVAVATGARLGELLALDWDEVSLTEGRVRIKHTYNVLDGLTAPKTKGSVRTLYLTPAAVQEFERMAATRSTGPVFAGRDGERLNAAYVARVLERAREAARLPKNGESGLPRSFHSFRSTFDRRMLEQGRHPEWIRAQLGHASLELTLNQYGRWSEAALQAEASEATDTL